MDFESEKSGSRAINIAAYQSGYTFIEIMMVTAIVGTLASMGFYTGIFRLLMPAMWPNPMNEQAADNYARAVCYSSDTDLTLSKCLDFGLGSCEERLSGPVKRCLDKHLTGFNKNEKQAVVCANTVVGTLIQELPYKNKKECGPMLAAIERLKRMPKGGVAATTPGAKPKPVTTDAFFKEMYGK